MSSTRTAKPGGPLRDERFMSSREYEDLRGLSGNSVAAKTAKLNHTRKSSLLFFIHYMSWERGGLKKFCQDFLAAFPERFGSETMRKIGTKPEQVYTAGQVEKVRSELGLADKFPLKGEAELDYFELLDEPAKDDHSEKAEDKRWELANRLWERKQRADHYPSSYPASAFVKNCHEMAGQLDQFLTRLCADPELPVPVDQETEKGGWQAVNGKVPWFKSIMEALLEYQQRYEEQALKAIVITEAAKQTFEALDMALKLGRIAVIEGREGVGKTEAVKAWCAAHRGQARYVSLRGFATKTAFLSTLFHGLGLGSPINRTTSDMESIIQVFLERSGLMLIFDEGHYLLPQGDRSTKQPELLNWVYTACTNYGLPVAIATTSLFGARVQYLEQKIIWNSGQFKRRICRYARLKEPSIADVEAVARKLLPEASNAMLKSLIGRLISTRQPFSNLVDTVEQARVLAPPERQNHLAFEDLDHVLKDLVLPSEMAKALAFETRHRQTPRGSRRTSIPGRPQPEELQSAPAAASDRIEETELIAPALKSDRKLY